MSFLTLLITVKVTPNLSEAMFAKLSLFFNQIKVYNIYFLTNEHKTLKQAKVNSSLFSLGT